MRLGACIFILIGGIMGNLVCAEEAVTVPLPKNLGDPTKLGLGVQRTMNLLAGSTPQKRNTVRVLFYGQSGMEADWWNMVADSLKKRFPNANIIIENRALGGFPSQRLVRTSETDLYSFYPDLMIFNVSGGDGDYEDIIRRTLERTTSEILILTDYVRNAASLTEETDPAKIVRGGPQWTEYFNYCLLPALAEKYGCGIVDVRNLWKEYIRDSKLDVTALLGHDKSHLGPGGCQVMASLVNAYLVRRADAPKADERVQTFSVGKDVQWKDGKLTLTFTGNRIDAVAKPGTAPAADVTIDGSSPSAHPELYGFTRALATPGGKWPVILKMTSKKPLQVEDWSMHVTTDPKDPKRYTFTLQGALTGVDGSGSSDQRFVSNSGRIAIDPADWDVEYALSLPGIKPVPEQFYVRWKVIPFLADAFTSPGVKDDGTETVVTLAQGLVNGPHTLVIKGDPQTPIGAIRVYKPLPPVKERIVQ